MRSISGFNYFDLVLDGKMMNNNEQRAMEILPEGVITMLLQGYVDTINFLKKALYLAIASQVVTMLMLAWYALFVN